MDNSVSGRPSRGRMILLIIAFVLIIVFVVVFFLTRQSDQLVSFSNNEFSISHPRELTPRDSKAGGTAFDSDSSNGAIKRMVVLSRNTTSISTPEKLAERLDRTTTGAQSDTAEIGRKTIAGREVLIFSPPASDSRDGVSQTAYIFEDSKLWSIQILFKEDSPGNDQILEEIVETFNAK